LISPSGQQIEYVLGLYYYDEDYSIDEAFNLRPQFCNPPTTASTGLPEQSTAEREHGIVYSKLGKICRVRTDDI